VSGYSLRTIRTTAPANETPSDAELVRRAVARDPRAATLVWDRYATMVRGIVRRALGPDHEAEDVVQDAFIGFFKNVGALRDPSLLRPFLVGITFRTARTALRKRRVRRWLRLSDDGQLPEVSTSAGDPRARDALRCLYRILDEVDDRGRLAFLLRHVEGYELTEAAEALGVSLATLKRALAKTEAHLLERSGEDDLLGAWLEATRG
jgi:RNA polymerase sigma-70 factor (ECF subfamily)